MKKYTKRDRANLRRRGIEGPTICFNNTVHIQICFNNANMQICEYANMYGTNKNVRMQMWNGTKDMKMFLQGELHMGSRGGRWILHTVYNSRHRSGKDMQCHVCFFISHDWTHAVARSYHISRYFWFLN